MDQNSINSFKTLLSQASLDINVENNVDVVLTYQREEIELLKPIYLQFIADWQGNIDNIGESLITGDIGRAFYPQDTHSENIELFSLLNSPNKNIRSLAYQSTRYRTPLDFKLLWLNIIENDPTYCNGYNTLTGLDSLKRLYSDLVEKKEEKTLMAITEVILSSSWDPNTNTSCNSFFYHFVIQYLYHYLTSDQLEKLTNKLVTFFTHHYKNQSLWFTDLYTNNPYTTLKKNYPNAIQGIEIAIKTQLKQLLDITVFDNQDLQNENFEFILSLFCCLRGNPKLFKSLEKELLLKIDAIIDSNNATTDYGIRTLQIYIKHLNESQLLKVFNQLLADNRDILLHTFKDIEIKDFIPLQTIIDYLKNLPKNLTYTQSGKVLSLYIFLHAHSSEKRLPRVKEICQQYDIMEKTFNSKLKSKTPALYNIFYYYYLGQYKLDGDFSNITKFITMIKNDKNPKYIKVLHKLFSQYRQEFVNSYKSTKISNTMNDLLEIQLDIASHNIKPSHIILYQENISTHISILNEIQYPKKKINELLSAIINNFQETVLTSSFLSDTTQNFSCLLFINAIMNIQKQHSIWLDHFNFTSLKPIFTKNKLTNIHSYEHNYMPLGSQLMNCKAEIIATYLQDQKNFHLLDTFHSNALKNFIYKPSNVRTDTEELNERNHFYLLYLNFDLKFKSMFLKKLIQSYRYENLHPLNFNYLIKLITKDKIVEDNLQNLIDTIDHSESFLSLFESYPDYKYWLNSKSFQRIFLYCPNSIKSKIYNQFQNYLGDTYGRDDGKFKYLNNCNENSLENFLNPIENSKTIPHYLLKMVVEKIYQDITIPSTQKVSFSFVSWSFFYYCSDLFNLQSCPFEMKSSTLNGKDFSSPYCLLSKGPLMLNTKYANMIPIAAYQETMENLEYLKIDELESFNPFMNCKRLKKITICDINNGYMNLETLSRLITLNAKTLEFVEVFEQRQSLQYQEHLDFKTNIEQLLGSKTLRPDFKYRYNVRIIQTTLIQLPLAPLELPAMAVIENLTPVKHITFGVKFITDVSPFKLTELFGPKSPYKFETLRINFQITEKKDVDKLLIESLTLIVKSLHLKTLIVGIDSNLISTEPIQFQKLRSTSSLNQIFKLLNSNLSITTFKYRFDTFNPKNFNPIRNEIVVDPLKLNIGEFYLPNKNSFKTFKRILM